MEGSTPSLRQHKLCSGRCLDGDLATIGGMTAQQQLRAAARFAYGNMVHNGRANRFDPRSTAPAARFAEVPGNFVRTVEPERYRGLVR